MRFSPLRLLSLSALLIALGLVSLRSRPLPKSFPTREPVTALSSARRPVDAPTVTLPPPAESAAHEAMLPGDPAFANQPGEASWREEMRQLRLLAAENLEAALVEVAGLPLREDRDAALTAVCLQAAARDPALALSTAWRLKLGKPGGPTDSAVLEKLAAQWAASDLPAALTWAVQLPREADDDRRDHVIKALAESWAKSAPAEAANLVADEIPESALQCRAAMAIVSEWAQRDPTGANAWAATFPQGALRDAALQTLASVRDR